MSPTCRRISARFALVIALLIGNQTTFAAETPAARLNPSVPTLFIIGDSTVKNGTKGQRGWGEEIAAHFDPSRIKIANHAIGGRSSRTFLTEGRWEKILADLKPGDFVLMQFGHNDGGIINDTSRARGTIKGVGEETEEIDNLMTKKHEIVHSFGWYMRKYVADAKAKSATPIVLSLVPRKIWKDGKIVRGTKDYGQWAAAAAKAEGAAFIDLNDIVARHYEELGPEKVNALFGDEHTHTNVEGAQLNAASVVEGIRSLNPSPLAAFLAPEPKTAATEK